MAPNLITRDQNLETTSETPSPTETKRVRKQHHQMPIIVIVAQDHVFDQLLPQSPQYIDYPYHCSQRHYWRSKKATFLFCVVIMVLLALFCITIIATTNIMKQTMQSNQDLAHVIETSCGPVKGEYEAEHYVFHGIPYAIPPVGDQRWKPPIPNQMSNGYCQIKGQIVSTYPNVCYQQNSIDNKPIGQEDCLYLNVWMPRSSLKKKIKLPVVVIMQGEGQHFQRKARRNSFELINHYINTGDAVILSVNYRLGVFGFLAMDAKDENSRSNITGNYGLMDQMIALEWVSKNIEHFNGDHNKVMVYGESSGTETMLGLLRSPRAKNLFQGILAINPALLPIKPFKDVENLNNAVLSESRCQKDIKCLRRMRGEELLQAFSLNHAEHKLEKLVSEYLNPRNHNLALIIDGTTLFNIERKQFSGNQGDQPPVMIGYFPCQHLCDKEVKEQRDRVTLISQLFKMNRKSAKEAIKLYVPPKDKKIMEVIGEMIFDIKMCRTKQMLLKANLPDYYSVILPKSVLAQPQKNEKKHSSAATAVTGARPSAFLCTDNLAKELMASKVPSTAIQTDLDKLWKEVFSLINTDHSSNKQPNVTAHSIVNTDHSSQPNVTAHSIVTVEAHSHNQECAFWNQQKSI